MFMSDIIENSEFLSNEQNWIERQNSNFVFWFASIQIQIELKSSLNSIQNCVRLSDEFVENVLQYLYWLLTVLVENESLFTALSDITGVTVTRSQTELIITWNKLNNNDIYNYTLKSQEEGRETHFTGSAVGDVITHTYSSLTQGTEHRFTLFTVVNNVLSRGYSFKNITSKFW